MNTLWHWFRGLGFTTGGAMLCQLSLIALSANSAIAEITPDATLPNNSRVTPQGNTRIIQGGTNQGSNLFHSFEKFSVLDGVIADFQNAANIQNIITRVTGKSISNINGTIRANGTANLFFINPNGIIFGPNASLDIGGSFIGSTASSVNFADDIKFSATEPQSKPLLTVNVPIGLQFGATAAPIRNQSQASPDGATIFSGQPVGLQVQIGKTLALLGGDVIIEGGNLTASEGRIELGSVAENSLVSLNPTDQGWVLGYEGVQEFKNIQIIQRNYNDDFISSVVDASGESGGNIQAQGKLVEIAGNDVFLRTQTRGSKDGGDLKITAKKLIVRDGAQVNASTVGKGKGGNLTVNASESVELISSFKTPSGSTSPSTLAAGSFAAGNAGNITINTARLRVQEGAAILVNSGASLDPSGKPRQSTGRGGNVTINASESVELIGTSTDGSLSSGLLSSTEGSGNAGNLRITTKELIIRDRAEINLNSEIPDPEDNIFLSDIEGFGEAGSLTVDADSILLDKGKISANTVGGGGNISLNSPLLILRNGSNITTNASGINIPGGNINIDAEDGFIIANENSDITANSTDFRGGNINILNVEGIFGIQPRDSPTPDSDITATGATSDLSGRIAIDQNDADPDQDVLEVDVNLVDGSKLINRNFCALRGKSNFTITGRGGLPPSPNTVLDSQSVWEDWRLNPVARKVSQHKGKTEKVENNTTVNKPVNKIVEAQRAVINSKGEVMLVADAAPQSYGNLPSGCE